MLSKIGKNIKCQGGFTLIELMIVIAIISVLATIAIPKLTSTTNNAKVAKLKADMATIESAISIYNVDTGKDATSVAVLAVKETVSGKGPWLVSEPKPPKGDITLTDGNKITIGDTDTDKYLINTEVGRVTIKDKTAEQL